jgi:glycosyltransferase involved in cell wall biosynthesis
MNPTPSISVLVRTAGRDVIFLRRALASIHGQTLAPQQVVVLNAGGDATAVEAAIHAASFPADMVTLRHHSMLAPATAANRALDAATGEWIAFLDDDDTWEPGFIARVAPAIARENHAADFGGVVTQTLALHERAGAGVVSEVRREPFNPSLLAIDLAALAVENQFTNNALVFRRSAVATVGNFRDDLTALYDWEFNVRLATRFRLEVVPEMLARYHLRPANDGVPNTPRLDLVRAGIQIRNEWVRADLAAGRIGLGQLALAGETIGLRLALSRWERWRRRFNGWLGRGGQ